MDWFLYDNGLVMKELKSNKKLQKFDASNSFQKTTVPQKKLRL